jgi:cyclase
MTTLPPFTAGLHEVGDGCYAYLQPDGGWGLSNAGLVAADEGALLVDTLFDLPRTREMLQAMKRSVPAAGRIATVVNTHSHPDHTAGNALLPEATVIASHATIEEMRSMADGEDLYGKILRDWRSYGEAGAYLHEIMGSRFALTFGHRALPAQGFDEEYELHVGTKLVRLVKIGPAHTRGDAVVFLPRERVLYTGDVLFNEVHPAVTGLPVSAWIAACERLLTWDIEVIVPGHGPVADLAAVRRQRDYFTYLQREARARFDAGLQVWEAAHEISLEACRGWADEERIIMTLHSLYGEFGAPRVDPLEVLAMAHRLRRKSRGPKS